MSDFRSSRFERDAHERETREREPSLAATLELGFRRLVTSVFVAGGLIAIAVYASGSDDDSGRYQVTAADGRIIRVNTESGTVIACEGDRCAIVLRRGQRLEEELHEEGEAGPAAAEGARAPALPAPAQPSPPSPQQAPAAPAPAAEPQQR